MTDLVPLPSPTAGAVERVWTTADDRNAEKLTAEQDIDPWVKTEAWKRRWLRTYATRPGHTSTREQYEAGWKALQAYAVAIDVAPIEFERADIERWTEELRTIGNRAAVRPRAVGEVRVKWFMSMASAFYAYCLDDPASGVARNPVPKKRPRISDESPQQHLTREQLKAMLAVSDADGGSTSALLALLCLGLRITEAVEARIENITTTGGRRIVRVIRKGTKVDNIPIPDPSWARIQRASGGRRSGPVLMNGARPMSRRKAYHLVADIAARAGIEGKVGPHTVRHAVVTHLLEDGVPLHLVQYTVGHSDSKTTIRYWRTKGKLDDSPLYELAASYYGTPTDERSET
jgi:integrase/recombinase XerD